MRTYGLKAVGILLVLAMCHLVFIPVSGAQDSMGMEETMNGETESSGSIYGMGLGSFFLTIPYGVTKVVLASLGGIFGGFTYIFSAGSERASNAVWDTCLRGTYVITPDHLKGNKPIRFFGVPPEGRER
ncbi:MAG: hypothetical protein ACE5NA_10155 [Nitrospiraceae bacterium]